MKRIVSVLAILLLVASAIAFAGGGEEKEQKVLNVAAVDYPQFNAYTMRINASKKACEDFGVKYTLIQPGEVTVASDVDTFLNVINQGFDAIIVEPWSYEPWLEAMKLAKEKGIVLVNVHVPYDDPQYFISQLVIDNKGYGITAMDILAKEFGGKANILIMMNNPGIMNQTVQRQAIIDRCAEKYPNMKVIATEFTQIDPIIAAERLEAALTAYPQIDTILFLESGTVTVAANVAKEMGVLDKVRIIGIDDPPDLIASIKKGEVWGSFNQNFQRQGYEAIRNIVDHFKGNPFPKFTDAGIVLIKKDNVDTYLDQMWAPISVKGKPYSNLTK
jgi:ABC-type sugar transport system substrate-binding protein